MTVSYGHLYEHAKLGTVDVERFMREHHDPRWKPKPLPKFRALPRLSDEKFRKLMLDAGARQTSE